MNDITYEQVVLRTMKKSDKIMQFVMYAILVLFIMIGGFFIGIAAPLISIAVGLFLRRFYFQSIEKEYEYDLINQNLSFSVMHKKLGKENVVEVNLTKVYKIAPKTSKEVAYEKPDQFLFYSAMSDEAEVYALLFEEKHKKYCILFDPDEQMLEYIKLFAGPRLYT